MKLFCIYVHFKFSVKFETLTYYFTLILQFWSCMYWSPEWRFFMQKVVCYESFDPTATHKSMHKTWQYY
jgi:hypothetical protein